MFGIILSLFISSSQASECHFGYINYGEDLAYICGEQRQKVELVGEKVVFNNKLASEKVQQKYENWLGSKRQNKIDLKAQKDKFNCAP